MTIIIHHQNGNLDEEIEVPDEIFQNFAKGHISSIAFNIDKGPQPRIMIFRHNFS